MQASPAGATDGAHLAFGHLGLEQLRQHRHCGLEGRRTLFGQVGHSLGHATTSSRPRSMMTMAPLAGFMTHDGSGDLGRVGRHSVRHWLWVRGGAVRACGVVDVGPLVRLAVDKTMQQVEHMRLGRHAGLPGPFPPQSAQPVHRAGAPRTEYRPSRDLRPVRRKI